MLEDFPCSYLAFSCVDVPIICTLKMCLLFVLIGFLIFLLLSFKDSLYILDNSALLNVAFTTISLILWLVLSF